MPQVSAPPLTHVCDLSVAVDVPISVGDIGTGERRVVGISGGEVTGPRLSGRVLPGGADVQILRAGGHTELTARYLIEAADGALIFVENSGIRNGPPEVMERIRLGQPVDPALVYFRAVPRFETSAPQHRWLMHRLFISCGVRRPDRVVLSVYEVG